MLVSFLLLMSLLPPQLVAGVRQERERKIADLLTVKLFAMADLLHSLDQHVSSLGDWKSRADQLLALESSLAAELADVKQSVQQCQDQQESLSQQLAGISAGIGSDDGQHEAMARVVAELTASLRREHTQTRSECGSGFSRLQAMLEELQAAGGSQEAAIHGVEARLEAKLKMMGEMVQQIDRRMQQLSDQLQQRMTTTTPAPTEDPQKLFLQNLLSGLNKRRRNLSD